jgi:PIN domain nuclease of toxin-antitoxin system
MKLLIDTHVLLWIIEGDISLSDRARRIFLDSKNELFFSAASFWEICIKLSIKKLDLGRNWNAVIDRELNANSIHWLPIRQPHCIQTIALPWHHRDPFDRLLIAQALIERCAIMTDDAQIKRYSVKTVW